MPADYYSISQLLNLPESKLSTVTSVNIVENCIVSDSSDEEDSGKKRKRLNEDKLLFTLSDEKFYEFTERLKCCSLNKVRFNFDVDYNELLPSASSGEAPSKLSVRIKKLCDVLLEKFKDTITEFDIKLSDLGFNGVPITKKTKQEETPEVQEKSLQEALYEASEHDNYLIKLIKSLNNLRKLTYEGNHLSVVHLLSILSPDSETSQFPCLDELSFSILGILENEKEDLNQLSKVIKCLFGLPLSEEICKLECKHAIVKAKKISLCEDEEHKQAISQRRMVRVKRDPAGNTQNAFMSPPVLPCFSLSDSFGGYGNVSGIASRNLSEQTQSVPVTPKARPN